MTLETGATGKAFGSITVKDLEDALKKELGDKVTIERHAIQLEKPIKETGLHEVPVKLHADVTATLKVNVKSAPSSPPPNSRPRPPRPSPRRRARRRRSREEEDVSRRCQPILRRCRALRNPKRKRGRRTGKVRRKTGVIHRVIHRIFTGSLPNSLEAEQGVLGSMLIAPMDVIGECVERISEKAFYLPAHATIYALLVEFWTDQTAGGFHHPDAGFA